jgi:hypothetical protein
LTVIHEFSVSPAGNGYGYEKPGGCWPGWNFFCAESVWILGKALHFGKCVGKVTVLREKRLLFILNKFMAMMKTIFIFNTHCCMVLDKPILIVALHYPSKSKKPFKKEFSEDFVFNFETSKKRKLKVALPRHF